MSHKALPLLNVFFNKCPHCHLFVNFEKAKQLLITFAIRCKKRSQNRFIRSKAIYNEIWRRQRLSLYNIREFETKVE